MEGERGGGGFPAFNSYLFIVGETDHESWTHVQRALCILSHTWVQHNQCLTASSTPPPPQTQIFQYTNIVLYSLECSC